MWIMEELTDEFIIELKRKYQKAHYLSKEACKKDPVSEPYKSKYEAKNVLIEVEDELNTIKCNKSDVHSKVNLIKALVHFEIGLIQVETEETSLGEENFKKSIEIIEKNVIENDCVILAISVYNQYGIIWSLRGDPLKAQDCLKKAENIYCDYKNKKETIPPLNLDEIIYCEMEKSSDNRGWENLESANTYTLYYLGQVYEHLKKFDLAALYLHRTLKRQLKQLDFDPPDWALNCAMHSQYFIRKNEFKVGRHYLACSSYILDKHQSLMCSENNAEHLEKYQRHQATIARVWVKYCISLLATSKEKISNENYEEPQNSFNFEVAPEEHLKVTEKCEPHEFLTELQIAKIEEQIPYELACDYSRAKLIFLKGQKWINDAKTFYTLEDNASDYIIIIQDNSKLYRLLAFFETDLKNVCKMHKRRIDILEETLFSLNPQYYLATCRQLMFELAEVYSEMMDLKLAIMDKENARNTHAVQKVNMLIAKAIKYFERFIESYKDQATKQLPITLSEEDAHPILIAYFYLGRLYTKFITSKKESKIKNLKAGQSCYQFLLDYICSNQDQKKIIEEEYKIAKEMVELLPGKIQATISNVNLKK